MFPLQSILFWSLYESPSTFQFSASSYSRGREVGGLLKTCSHSTSNKKEQNFISLLALLIASSIPWLEQSSLINMSTHPFNI